MILTTGQRQVVSFLAEGENSDGIARILRIPRETVRSRLKAAYRKLGATNAASAVLRAIELGEIRVDGPAVTPAPIRESPDGAIAVYIPNPSKPLWHVVKSDSAHCVAQRLKTSDVAGWRQLHYCEEGNRDD